MTQIAFDTLAFANKLKQAGLDPKIAEVQAEETAKILNDLTGNHLETKFDFHSLESKIDKVKNDLELKLESFKTEIISQMMKISIWLMSILGSLQILFHFLK